MKNNNTYDLLDPDLFKKYKKEVLYIDKWLKIMNRSNGWHYHLDILWIIFLFMDPNKNFMPCVFSVMIDSLIRC